MSERGTSRAVAFITESIGVSVGCSAEASKGMELSGVELLSEKGVCIDSRWRSGGRRGVIASLVENWRAGRGLGRRKAAVIAYFCIFLKDCRSVVPKPLTSTSFGLLLQEIYVVPESSSLVSH